MVSRSVSTRTQRPYRSSICGYRATPTDVSPIGNLCRIIMPVHRLWSPRTRRYADLISCFESGLSQWIMGLDTVPLSCLLISFSKDLLSSFIGRSLSTLYNPCCQPLNFYRDVAFIFRIPYSALPKWPAKYMHTFISTYITRIITYTVVHKIWCIHA